MTPAERFWTDYARVVREARRAKGMTQLDLVQELRRIGGGGYRYLISEFETCQVKIFADRAAQFHHILGVQPPLWVPDE